MTRGEDVIPPLLLLLERPVTGVGRDVKDGVNSLGKFADRVEIVKIDFTEFDIQPRETSDHQRFVVRGDDIPPLASNSLMTFLPTQPVPTRDECGEPTFPPVIWSSVSPSRLKMRFDSSSDDRSSPRTPSIRRCSSINGGPSSFPLPVGQIRFRRNNNRD